MDAMLLTLLNEIIKHVKWANGKTRQIAVCEFRYRLHNILVLSCTALVSLKPKLTFQQDTN